MAFQFRVIPLSIAHAFEVLFQTLPPFLMTMFQRAWCLAEAGDCGGLSMVRKCRPISKSYGGPGEVRAGVLSHSGMTTDQKKEIQMFLP